MGLKLKNFAPAALSVLLLGMVGGYRAALQTAPPEAEQYHLAIREQAASLPLRIGNWVGHDLPVTPGAVALLHPNLIVCRGFTDVQSGRSVEFLVVQCRDARDMLGHYPPVCYVAHGWTAVSSEPRDWHIADRDLHGTAYEFSKTRLEGVAHVIVYDFMLLPDGRTCRDMDTVEAAARAYRTRFFGAAQVQVEFDASVLPEERDRIFAQVISANSAVLDRIRSGVNP